MNTQEQNEIRTGPTLFLDAAGTMTFVGILQDGKWLEWASSEKQALESLFVLTRDLLHRHSMKIEDLRAFGFCDGPGSVLGLRLASACILAWQKTAPLPKPVFHYHSLELARTWILDNLRPHPASWLVTDYRRNRWLGTPLEKENCILEIDTSTFPEPHGEKQLFYLPQRKSWDPPPAGHQTILYPFKSLPRFMELNHCGRIRSDPVLALPGKSDYRKWTPARHRAPEETPFPHE